MGFFEKIVGKGKVKSSDVIEMMIATADFAMKSGDYAKAVDTYKHILSLDSNATAQYNLGALYAQGKGIEQDFVEAAYWFHQAELGGDEQAGKMCLKCSLDFLHQEFALKTPEKLYIDMERLIKHVMPETNDVNVEVCRIIYGMAGNHFNKQEYTDAAKLFRAAAEYGNDGYSQNYLGVLYNAGAGLEKNDLVALYWFDKAVDSGVVDAAKTDRDGILNAYKANLSDDEFYEYMLELSGWCSVGSSDVPKDAEKAKYWRVIGEKN